MLNADWLLFNASIFLTMTRRIAVVPGDGIGKEVIPNALEVVRATGASVEFTTFDWGADRYLIDGTTIPADDSTINTVGTSRVLLPDSAACSA